MTQQSTQKFVMAIAKRAHRDWHKAVSQLTYNPDYQPARETKQEIEEFFCGEWFQFLCELEPELVSIAPRSCVHE
jgi:hypothetical protein